MFAPPVVHPVTAAPVAQVSRACAGATAPATSASLRTLRAAVLCLVNKQRRAHRLPPLRSDRRLDRSAQRWSNHMVATGTFTHGTNFASRITAAGFHWSAAAENIATGYLTPFAVVKAWMASEGHCRNILAPTYRELGVGVNRHPVRGWATGPATWTQDFGLGRHERPPSRNHRPQNGCPY